MVNITSLQNHVLGPSEDVPYAALTERAYPPTAFRERFMSVKILMQDEGYMNARCGAERMKQLDSACRPILANSGCILREAEADTVPNGIYLISLPVPRSQFQRQLGIVLSVMNRLAQDLGIMYTGVIETNVSGRMNEYDEQIAKKMFRLPQSLEEKITKKVSTLSSRNVLPNTKVKPLTWTINKNKTIVYSYEKNIFTLCHPIYFSLHCWCSRSSNA